MSLFKSLGKLAGSVFKKASPLLSGLAGGSLLGTAASVAGGLISGAQQSKAAAKAVDYAKADRQRALDLSYQDRAANAAARDADQRELNALRDRDQAALDAARDRDQATFDRYRDRDQRVSDNYVDRDQAISDRYRDRDQRVSDLITMEDQNRAIEYARGDEARMVEAHREAIGYDLTRMRDEAVKAGFNPLTVLAATGAANYARTAAPVLTTPFLGRSLVGSTVLRHEAVGSQVATSDVARSEFVGRPMVDQSSVFSGLSSGVQNARANKVSVGGYFGDAIAGLGSAYVDYTREMARAQADKDLAEAIRAGGSSSARYGTRSDGRGSFVEPRVVDARSVGNVPSSGHLGSVLPSDALASRTPIQLGGVVVPQSRTTSDASYWGQRYGEPGEWVGGIAVGVADAFEGLRQADAWLRERAQRSGEAFRRARASGGVGSFGDIMTGP